jgi:hypothetical protein
MYNYVGEGEGFKKGAAFFLLTPAVKDLFYKIQTSFFFIKKDIEEERGIKKQNT